MVYIYSLRSFGIQITFTHIGNGTNLERKWGNSNQHDYKPTKDTPFPCLEKLFVRVPKPLYQS